MEILISINNVKSFRGFIINLIIFLCVLFSLNIADACDKELVTYLDQAKAIAITLPQYNEQPDKSRQYDDEHWIIDPVQRKRGGYRYLLHNIAVSYSKIGCWEQALSTADLIENIGVKDSAWARIAIEYAKNDLFNDAFKLIKAIKYPRGGEIARKYVSKELIRAGRYDEARKVLRGAGIFGNHYESYYYQNAMNLAKYGKHDEAIKYVYSLNDMRHHVRNAFGDMLLLFQKRGDSINAKKILSYYENENHTDIPDYQISLYYLKENNIEKSEEYILKLHDAQRKARLMLDLALNDNTDKYYNDALKIIDKRFNQDSGNNWTIVTHTAYKVYLLKGQPASNSFIYKYIDKNDHIAEISHKSIIKKLFSKNKPDEILEYLKSVDGKMSAREYIETIANIRNKSLKEIPNISIFNNNIFIYRYIVIELLKNGYPEIDVLQAIEKNYKTDTSLSMPVKSELLRITAMVASSHISPKEANSLYRHNLNNLLHAYWLLGISQKNEAYEINSALKYKLYL